jgi:7,8-dihydropterin-6-yl-methyl-4-(beta-D-ribofuranosyl)aminobenzene 5'-phosphate synthase
MKRLTILIMMCLSPILAGKLTFTIVYNNLPYNDELTTDWGMSCFIQGSEKNILFDVGGDGEILLGNMRKLDISPEDIDIVFLSHIHHDHIGGLLDVLKENNKITVFLPKSFPKSVKEQIKKLGASFIAIDKSTEICESVYSSGELGGLWLKEQSLIIDTNKGLIVITGCAHPGVVKIAKKAIELIDKPIYLILGGFHLMAYSENEVNKIIKDLKAMKIENVGPSHCTGGKPIELFKKAWKDKFFDLGCGAVFELELNEQ